ncbi:MAG: TlpA family protein disulfide reductase [Nitrospirae bacterium]|nr:MAG: TlpA family protein disulfide reductase [Nitrospirota bacterium]
MGGPHLTAPTAAQCAKSTRRIVRERNPMARYMRILVASFMMALLGQAVFPVEPSWSMGERPPVTGMPAADFTLLDLQGKPQSLGQYRGKVVLLNFWATWCKPCTTEMPAMQACYDKLRDKGFVVLAVNELEDAQKVAEHVKAYGHTFPVLMDKDNRVANMYGVYGLPVSVLIDEQGVVQEYIKGGLLTEPKILEMVERVKTAAHMKTASVR